MGRKRRERKTPKPAKVLYSIRVDGELDGLLKTVLDIINKPGPAPYNPTGAGHTLTDMVNAILYDVFFDVKKHNTPREFIRVLSDVDWATNRLPLTREMVDVFFDATPAEVEVMRERYKKQKKNTP
jgi:hypothetical protein